ncbi:exodeoxyribonuclease VII large subunit [Inhella gelatinilytica]|uniref:Exodeoxyribonuclease VII large subunit n=1 Tax=Inhella gelatinilytica TaxID=2795030 RepID=A0A931NBU3_9BURK|nr:exodeoxyribonuclease VII large subunit [Inhella gelatinilytica]MBH9553953.1 exodeoxyribonuclease VII large subunit [Inhella gelatinilytica]
MTKTYLTTEYKDREQVKNLGARWDPEARRWFVPPGRDVALFTQWLAGGAAQAKSDVTLTVPSTFVLADRHGGVISNAGRSAISLSRLLGGVAEAVAQAYRAGVWTTVDVVKADLRKGVVYLEVAERDAVGSPRAQARALIWGDTAQKIVPAFERATGAVLGPGIKLMVRARPQVHPLYGLSLVIDEIDPDYTVGDLEARKREIRARLQSDGLFEANRRLPSPWDFNRVLVVAPEGAAGLGDFQAEAQRLERAGICEFTYIHSRFQGEGAAAEIRQVLLRRLHDWTAERRPPLDAIVIIRGGGAVNDLAWLNDYDLARCVCELKVPVLTGIGHERDSTILDEVANRCFDTPSKVILGIEAVIRQRAGSAEALWHAIEDQARRVLDAARQNVERAGAVVRTGARREVMTANRQTDEFLSAVRLGGLYAVRAASDITRGGLFLVRQHASKQVTEARMALPVLDAEIRSGVRQSMRLASEQADQAWAVITDRTEVQVRRAEDGANQAMVAVGAGSRRWIADASSNATALFREITGQGPQKTLGRGFALVRSPGGAVISSATGAPLGVRIEIEFHDGRMRARTEAFKEETPK